jgi:cytochrome c
MTMTRLTFTTGLLLAALMSAQAAYAAGDFKRGADVHEAQCAECHSLKEGKNKKGPSLFGVIGRKAGTLADVAYTDEMKASGVTWSAEKLREYLAGPKAMIPGTKMKYKSKMTPQETEDLLAFLATVK